ncbi:MAG: hypothetical protein IKX06_01600, partial [Clostridia bacterium]|nr:hypothetical protein [Clostridia bacterium]
MQDPFIKAIPVSTKGPEETSGEVNAYYDFYAEFSPDGQILSYINTRPASPDGDVPEIGLSVFDRHIPRNKAILKISA